ncbi:hypothetical protein MKW92_031945, partial [Papaver armeniacum]
SLLYHLIFFVIYLYITALWHLAFVVSVLEPNVWGLSAIKRSNQLLRQKKSTAFRLAGYYLAAAGISKPIVYGILVFHNAASGKVSLFGYEFVASHNHGMLKVLLVVCAVLLTGVNLSGLLVQNMFYYVCKSHHHQVIDKEALHNYLELRQ